MKYQFSKYLHRCFVLFAVVSVTACGGGGSGTGSLSAGITDSAIEELSAVNLHVIGLELKSDAAGKIEVDLRDPVTGDALEFNLMDYQHGETFPLFDDERVPAGRYEHARLILEAPAKTAGECAVQDPLAGSHVVMNTGDLVPIYVPSGFNTGIKLGTPFEVAEDGSTQIVIDLDLQRALHRPTGQVCYFLRPAYRVEMVSNTGSIAGSVDLPLLDGSNGLCSDSDPETGNAVYVFSGLDQTPDDIDTIDTDGNDPVATSQVTLDTMSGQYQYRVAYLPAGDYTAAFTCKADLERLPDPDAGSLDEQQANDELDFQQAQNATVNAQMTTAVNFSVP